MKPKQQVISRFFAPKSASPPSLQSTSKAAAARTSSSTIQWPPLKTSASLKRLHKEQGSSPTKKALVDNSARARKRSCSEVSYERVENGNPVDLERPEICSDAVPLCQELEEHNEQGVRQNTQFSLFHATYKRRRRRGSSLNKKSGVTWELDVPYVKDGAECQNSASGKPSESSDLPSSDPARHKKFVETLQACSNNEGVSSVVYERKSSKEQYTPLEQQVVELKSRYKDVLLMVEVGYRYRMFGEDAESAARVLGIVAYNDHNFLTASIPAYRLHVHVRRLVEAGYKVGVVRQMETAAIKAHGGNKLGPFTRGLSALYTRATLEAAADLGGGETPMEMTNVSNYLMCITEQLDTSSLGTKILAHKQGPQLGSKEADTGSMAKGAYDTTIGVVAVETATGDVMYGQFKDTVLRSELEAHLLTCSPAELVLASPLSPATEKLLTDFAGPSSNVRIERVACEALESDSGLSEILGFYEAKEDTESRSQGDEEVDAGLEAIMKMPVLVTQALALALRHLKQFGLEKVLRLGATFRPFADVSEMSLSSNTLQQLEILQNSSDGSTKGSLLWLMDHTHTAFGARLFRHWLTHPLRDRALISARLDAVSEIVESMGSIGGSQCEGSFPGSSRGGGSVGAASRGRTEGVTKGPLAAVLASLKRIPDIERGITRIFHRTATAAEFVAVIQALVMAIKQLQWIHSEGDNEPELVEVSNESLQRRSQLLKRLFAAASSSVVSKHAERFLACLNRDAAAAGDKHNLFVCGTGKFPMVEKLQEAVQEAEQHLDSLLSQYKKLLKMPSLQYTSVSGSTHLIEVAVAQRVPQDWVKVCSTKKTNRFHPPEVLLGLEALALAKEELTVECNTAWESFLADFASHYVEFRTTVHALAALDCLYSLAIVSRNQGYTRPEFVENGDAQLMIEGGRHPVLEATLQDGFVPNDTRLHAGNECCQIITGPNMGGKSCYIRQVALISIMAQVGSYVPAISAKLHAIDAVYTRMGASDSIQHGSSTFLEELSEASTILQRATPHSLVIIDELGRGTSTHDGVAIAYSTLEYLLKEKRCLTLFVTHYPKIAELRGLFPGKIGAYHVSYLAEPSPELTKGGDAASKRVQSTAGVAEEAAADRITFLYKLVEGVANRSFGLHVARLAQIPEACVLRASSMAANLEKQVKLRSRSRKQKTASVDETSGTRLMILYEASNAGNTIMDSSLGDEKGPESHAAHLLARSNDRVCHKKNEGSSLEGMAEVTKMLCSVLLALKGPDLDLSNLVKIQEQKDMCALTSQFSCDN